MAVMEQLLVFGTIRICYGFSMDFCPVALFISYLGKLGNNY